MELNLLTGLKNFLFDRTIYAVAAMQTVAIVWLVKKLLEEKDARVTMAMSIAPLTDKLLTFVNKAASSARSHRNRGDSLPPPSKAQPREVVTPEEERRRGNG